MPPYIIQSRCELRVTDNSLSERTVTRAAADMNAKFVFVVLIALQVSLALCEMPAPDADVVQKFEDMKAVFYKRLVNLYRKLDAAASGNENLQGARDALANNQRVGTAGEVLMGLKEQMAPAAGQAQNAALGVYSAYLRPFIGEYLQDGITRIKTVLDQVMPAEQN